MASTHCWLCVHCDLDEVNDMMKFVEEKSPIMHIDVIADQVCEALAEKYPDDKNITDVMIKEHITRHVVTPVASVTRITRDLLDMCETLRPTRESLTAAKRAPKRRRKAITMGSAEDPPLEYMPMSPDTTSQDESDNEATADTTRMYLRTVGQVMAIYRMHSKLMQVG